MRKEILSSVTAVMGIIFLFVYSSVAFSQEQAEAPVYKDGECWQFNVTERDFVGRSSNALGGLYEVCYSEGKFKVFELQGDQRTQFAAGAAPLLAMLNQGKYQGGEHLRFPLYVGNKWDLEYSTKLIGGRRDMLRRAEIKVVGIEDITTAAGTCRAFKLIRDDSAGAGSGWLFTYYYCPATKSIVKALFDFSVGTGSGGKREIELAKEKKGNA